jgi:hypothetical protein
MFVPKLNAKEVSWSAKIAYYLQLQSLNYVFNGVSSKHSQSTTFISLTKY